MNLRGLSLTGPWDAPMTVQRAEGGKAAENRSRALPKKLLNTYLALHTAQSFEGQVIPSILERLPGLQMAVNRKEHLQTRAGYIIAVTQVVGCVEFDQHSSDLNRLPVSWEDQEKWARGEYVYLLKNLFVLPERIPHLGSLGFWRIQPEALERVLSQLPPGFDQAA